MIHHPAVIESAKVLLAMVESVTGPDRRIDAELDCLFIYKGHRPAEPDDHLASRNGVAPSPGYITVPTGFLVAGRRTGSLDDALYLLDREFPRCSRQLVAGEPWPNPWVKLSPLLGGGRHPVEGRGATLPLAVLSAFLRAVIARGAQ